VLPDEQGIPEFHPEKKGERGISQSFPALLKWHHLPSIMPDIFHRASLFSLQTSLQQRIPEKGATFSRDRDVEKR
jgi:hypothetical protein